MIKIYLFIIIFLFNVFSIAQNPPLNWAKKIGGTNNDSGSDIVVDFSGNVYSLGKFQGTVDFDPSVNVFNLTSNTVSDIFITKLDASGNFVWTKKLGEIGATYLYPSLAIDKFGHLFIGCSFKGILDVDPGINTFNIGTSGNYTGFILNLDSSGNFIWVKTINSDALGLGVHDIKLDDFGNIYLTGSCNGTTNFDPGTSVNYLFYSGYEKGFVLKLNSSGSFVWVKSFVGNNGVVGISVAPDVNGEVYSCGIFKGITDFNPGSAVFNLNPLIGSLGDIYISKLDSIGNFVWAKKIGDIESQLANSIAVDKFGNLYTVGSFFGTIDFNPGSGIFNLTADLQDIFILKLNSFGNFIWAKKMGGTNSNEDCYSLSIDSVGNVFTIGVFKGTADFDPNAGIYNLNSNGLLDIFISKLDPLGNFVWAKNLGGISDDVGVDITIDKTGNLYSTGIFRFDCDFETDAGISNLTSVGGSDAYIYKMGQFDVSIKESIIYNKIIIGPNPNNGLFTIELTTSNQIIISNIFGQIVFNETKNEGIHSIDLDYISNGIYVVKIINDNNEVMMFKIIKQ